MLEVFCIVSAFIAAIYVVYCIVKYQDKQDQILKDHVLNNDWKTDAFWNFLFKILKNDSKYREQFSDYLIENNDAELNSYIHMLLVSGYDDSKEGIQRMISAGRKELNSDDSLSSENKKRYIYLLENFLYFMQESKGRFSDVGEYKKMIKEY